MARKKSFKSSAQRKAVMAKMSGMRYNKNAKLTGKTTKKIDKQILAKPAGKRVSKSGKVYFERRANRADKSRKQRL